MGHEDHKQVNPRVRLIDRLLGRSDIIFNGTTYMRRWRILHTKRFGIRIHNIVRDDDDRALHDHPFDFLSIILKGGYIEWTADGKGKAYKPGAVLIRSASALHRLDLFRDKDNKPIEAWTLVFRGPVLRRWGFLEVAQGAWQDAVDSFSNQEARRHREANGQARPSVYESAQPRPQ